MSIEFHELKVNKPKTKIPETQINNKYISLKSQLTL
jgi:hypothetical protein